MTRLLDEESSEELSCWKVYTQIKAQEASTGGNTVTMSTPVMQGDG